MLPLFVTGHGGGQAAITTVFAASGIAGVAGQLRVTDWCRRSLTPTQALLTGVMLMAAAFLPPATAVTLPGPAIHSLAIPAAVASALLLALATAIAYPFEMDTLTRLAHDRLVATHSGVYSTITGLGIAVGTLGAGALSDVANRTGHPALHWAALVMLGLASTAALAVLTHTPD